MSKKEAVKLASVNMESITITPPKFAQAVIEIEGHDPLKQLRMSEKNKNVMKLTHEAGSTTRSKKKREARDFKAEFEAATYRLPDGSYGINATSFRKALISACRVAQFKMTLAKLSIFVEADGYDVFDGTPLVRVSGTPEMVIDPVVNANGTRDLRARAMWRQWSCNVRLTWDADQFTATDIVNLFMRAGMQVGVGEGRPDSKNSAGCGFGRFKIKGMESSQ